MWMEMGGVLGSIGGGYSMAEEHMVGGDGTSSIEL